MNVPNKAVLRMLSGAWRHAGLVVTVLIAFGAGYLVRWGCAPAQVVSTPPTTAAHLRAHDHTQAPALWTCSMHPEIKRDGPGLCPKCNMPLVPVAARRGDEGSLREFATSKEATALMQIETAPVERRFVTAQVRMVGKVDYDETKLASITAWVPGRLDRLYVDYTGVPVRRGDHMVYLYSPEVLSAQEELLQAIRAVKELGASNVGLVKETARATVEAARDKLRLWGLTQPQIAEVETRGKPRDHVTIYAPIGGIVIHKNAQQGMYVTTGTRIYTIADLSQVWVRLDAYESDLSWVRYGQKVVITTEAYPGDTFTGMIAFIDPALDATTRTVKVRVNVPNAHGKLKPGLFVHGIVRAKVAGGGRVMDPDLAGKWMCPMHPDVVKATAGACDICEMPLVRTESLGYVATDTTTAQKPLVIPVTAALVTGTRAVVYVAVPGRDKPTYEGREIVLGPRAGDYYLVRSGLVEGERVVTNGNFKIDSALQIQARPSMMSPRGAPVGAHHPGPASWPTLGPALRKQFAWVFGGYFAIQSALATDDFKRARAAVSATTHALAAVDMRLAAGGAHRPWMTHAGELNRILASAGRAKGIEALRRQFSLLSDELTALARRFGGIDTVVYRHTCPMAFKNRGASWLQADDKTRNPYFGAAMFTCGEVTDVIPRAADADRKGGARE